MDWFRVKPFDYILRYLPIKEGETPIPLVYCVLLILGLRTAYGHILALRTAYRLT